MKTIKKLVFSLCFLLLLIAPSHHALADPAVVADTIPPLIDFLPVPPVPGEPDFERDVAIYQGTRSEKGSPRWEQATFDANDKAHLEVLFLDSFGLKINPQDTPATRKLLDMVIKYMAKTIEPAKDHYMRTRPFVHFRAFGSTCSPFQEIGLLTNGSYPSGHSSRGWGLALVLAEISPERQGGILKRGYELGQSRVICGVHWQSDVDSARLAASVAIVQLHNKQEFQHLLEKAKAEINGLRRP
jgi:acid phosphatase (class A)